MAACSLHNIMCEYPSCMNFDYNSRSVLNTYVKNLFSVHD